MEEIKSKLSKRAREEVNSVATLNNEALVELSTQPDCSDVAPTLPTYSSFKSSMYRKRRKRLPPLRKTRAEIDLTGDWVITQSGERFLLQNEGSSDRILIFSSDAMLHLLCDLEALTLNLQLGFVLNAGDNIPHTLCHSLIPWPGSRTPLLDKSVTRVWY